MMIIRLFIGAGAAALFATLPITPARQGLASHTPIATSPRSGFVQVPPAPYGEAGPADSLYRLGREAINRGDFRRAATLFAEISAKYPRSEYAPDAPYWRAFALYRAGRDDELRDALKVLDTQQSQFPKATTVADGKELAIRIRGELARRGDVQSAEKVQREAARPCTRDDGDSEIRAAAMNALLQMDAQNAIPIIKQVLQKRDECSVKLREQAVFLLSQKRSPDTEDILLDVLTNDPSQSVRENAVFWMGQVHTDKAAAALERIATSSPNMELREKAIFALHEHGSARAMAVLKQLAENPKAPDQVREQAIFWLGQGRSQENAEFLRSLFSKLDKSERNDELGKKILFSLSQMRGVGNDRWLLSIALDTTNSEELRGHALWTAGQAGVAGSELAAVYDRVSDAEVKEKLIWVLSESNDRVATDKLVEIAQKDRDIEMRKKALFWLGQKNDPRIRQIILDILNKP
ncbi:MAG TPA: HEAT repeat domain-containing protein [Gemmatimonadaceae bacterium]|nr:HEAT repeat domain-containing protein [Gemmatimonadaceae bacterium]